MSRGCQRPMRSTRRSPTDLPKMTRARSKVGASHQRPYHSAAGIWNCCAKESPGPYGAIDIVVVVAAAADTDPAEKSIRTLTNPHEPRVLRVEVESS